MDDNPKKDGDIGPAKPVCVCDAPVI